VARGVLGGRKKLFAESGRKFFAGYKLDVMLDARVKRRNDTAARGVAELADDGGMRAADDAHNASFGAAGAGVAAEAVDLRDDVIAVHGVFDGVARNENVANHIGKGDIGNDKAVAILMENEAPLDFIAGSGFLLDDFLGAGSGAGRDRVASGGEGSARGKVPRRGRESGVWRASGGGAAVAFFHVEGAGEILDGNGVVSKLKKTKDIVGTEVGGRGMTWPFCERGSYSSILVSFLKIVETFFAPEGYTVSQHTTN